jgi:hypothetical protein
VAEAMASTDPGSGTSGEVADCADDIAEETCNRDNIKSRERTMQLSAGRVIALSPCKRDATVECTTTQKGEVLAYISASSL